MLQNIIYIEINREHPMGIVKISDDLHNATKCMAKAMHRSINSQAEYWMRIGKMIEENPSMTFAQVRDLFVQQAFAEEMHDKDS